MDVPIACEEADRVVTQIDMVNWARITIICEHYGPRYKSYALPYILLTDKDRHRLKEYHRLPEQFVICNIGDAVSWKKCYASVCYWHLESESE